MRHASAAATCAMAAVSLSGATGTSTLHSGHRLAVLGDGGEDSSNLRSKPAYVAISIDRVVVQLVDPSQHDRAQAGMKLLNDEDGIHLRKFAADALIAVGAPGSLIEHSNA